MDKILNRYSGNIGNFIMITGGLHLFVGFAEHWGTAVDIVRSGIINAADQTPERFGFFWFQMSGLLVLFLGSFLQHYLNEYEKPVPRKYGYFLLTIAIIGCALEPVSGFYVYILISLPVIFAGSDNAITDKAVEGNERSMQSTIRPATDRDAESLSEMICENAKVMLLPHYNENQWNIFLKYYSSEIMRSKIKEQYVFCEEVSGIIVGTIALDKDFVVGFYTRLQYLNKGIGTRLMHHLEEFAFEKGLTEIQLAASPEGLLFYYKNGWEKVRDIAIEHYGVAFNETLMVKRIKR